MDVYHDRIKKINHYKITEKQYEKKKGWKYEVMRFAGKYDGYFNFTEIASDFDCEFTIKEFERAYNTKRWKAQLHRTLKTLTDEGYLIMIKRPGLIEVKKRKDDWKVIEPGEPGYPAFVKKHASKKSILYKHFANGGSNSIQAIKEAEERVKEKKESKFLLNLETKYAFTDTETAVATKQSTTRKRKYIPKAEIRNATADANEEKELELFKRRVQSRTTPMDLGEPDEILSFKQQLQLIEKK